MKEMIKNIYIYIYQYYPRFLFRLQKAGTAERRMYPCLILSERKPTKNSNGICNLVMLRIEGIILTSAKGSSFQQSKFH